MKKSFPAILSALVCLAVMALVLWLYRHSLMPVVLSAAILALIGGIFGILGFREFSRKHDVLKKAVEFPEAFCESLTSSDDEDLLVVEEKIDLIESDYRDLLIKLSEDRRCRRMRCSTTIRCGSIRSRHRSPRSH